MEHHTPANRGEKTRDALLAAAMDAFGLAGYDATSNRKIADAAGVNQALIGYHFGGKRGLYLAVFEHICEQMRLELLPLVATARSQFASIGTEDPDRRERCVRAIEILLCAILDTLSRPESKTWARLVMREQQDPSEAFEIIYEGFMQRLLGTLSKFAAMAEGIEEENDATRLRGVFLVSQVLVFAMTPAVVGRYMGWTDGNPSNPEFIKAQLHKILQQQFIGASSP